LWFGHLADERGENNVPARGSVAGKGGKKVKINTDVGGKGGGDKKKN